MNGTPNLQALFYPFHLCHEETLRCLLQRFGTLHFRDFMAIQFTAMAGMTASEDRMGDHYPELLAAGRIVQGYRSSGPLPRSIAEAVDRDLADPEWRSIFHHSLTQNRRFQLGLFSAQEPLLPFTPYFYSSPFTLQTLRSLFRSTSPRAEPDLHLEYGLALAKTSAALHDTAQLALRLQLTAATDSQAHFALFEQSRRREGWNLPHVLVLRKGY